MDLETQLRRERLRGQADAYALAAALAYTYEVQQAQTRFLRAALEKKARAAYEQIKALNGGDTYSVHVDRLFEATS